MRVLHIARREMLEQRRQPAMLAVIGSLYGIVALATLIAAAALQRLSSDAGAEEMLARVAGVGLSIDELAVSTSSLYAFLVFTQFLGIAAVMSGHAMLHDRQCGTLTFLLLAPVQRLELLAGKVLGAVSWPFLLYLAVNGVASLALAAMPALAPAADYLPRSASWWVAFLLGGPAWAVLVGATCTLVSSAARDVRMAQQAVWFVVFFASMLAGLLLTWALPAGVGAQVVVFLLAASGAAGVLFAGSQVISRDLSR